MEVTQHYTTLQVRIMGPNYVPGSKKDLYVKVRLFRQHVHVSFHFVLNWAAGLTATL